MTTQYQTPPEAGNFVGLLPCAGRNERFPLPFAKELLPVRMDGELRPVCECAVNRLIVAGVSEIVLVARLDKLDVVRHIVATFGHCCRFAIAIQQSFPTHGKSRGLLQAIAAALPWIAGRNVLMALPDTVIGPEAVLRDLALELQSGGDAVFGVFPTEHPEQLAPVVSGASGRIVEIRDKPATSEIKNTWGCIAWSPAFSRRLGAEVQRDPGLDFPSFLEASLKAGQVFIRKDVEGAYFHDIGGSSAWFSNLGLHAHPTVAG